MWNPLKRKLFDSVNTSKSFPVNDDGALIWPQDESALPWFDRSDAMDHVNAWFKNGDIDKVEFDYLDQWVTEGFITVKNLIDPERVKNFRKEVDGIWERDIPYENMIVSDVHVNGVTNTHTSHEDILAIPRQERLEARKVSSWRIGELHLFADAAKKIFDEPRTKKICEMIFRTEAIPRYSLTFHKGSQQLLHQDSPVFHVYPRNHLIGVWIAAEDINPDSGPLVFCPKSHREELFPEFDNYPQTNRRTCDEETSERYDQYVRDLAKEYEERLFLPEEGEALFWHGQLIHGGTPIQKPELTRYSMVIHYMAQGTDVGSQMQGPFNW